MIPLLAISVFALVVWIGRNPRRAGRLTSRFVRRSAPPSHAEPMTISRAASLLGVPTDATHAQAQAAYRRLIRLAHPDVGGTAGLAAELNAARDAFARRARHRGS